MKVDGRKGLFIPELIEDDCNHCRLCLKVCPSYSIDKAKLNREIFGKEPEDKLLGHYIDCYLAYSNDYDVRYNSASGGLVTSLLVFALEQGLIDGALVTRLKKNSPLEPEPFIARTREDILEASGSKYCPTHANIALKEIVEKEGRYAVVGLPCQIDGIRKAEASNKILRERIKFHFGIFCSHTLTFGGTEFLLRKLGIRNEELVEILYRSRGWPGGIVIRLNNGGERFIPNQGPLWKIIFGGFFFTSSCCLSCSDVTNELADISFGDPWLREIMMTEREGKSVIISRSKQGESLLHAASSNGAITLEVLDAKDVITSQRMFLHFKKVNIDWRRGTSGESEERVDAYSSTGFDFSNRLVAYFTVINSRIGLSRARWFLLRYIPVRILYVYVDRFYKHYTGVINRFFNKSR